jgi:hypothetical protein
MSSITASLSQRLIRATSTWSPYPALTSTTFIIALCFLLLTVLTRHRRNKGANNKIDIKKLKHSFNRHPCASREQEMCVCGSCFEGEQKWWRGMVDGCVAWLCLLQWPRILWRILWRPVHWEVAAMQRLYGQFGGVFKSIDFCLFISFLFYLSYLSNYHLYLCLLSYL